MKNKYKIIALILCTSLLISCGVNTKFETGPTDSKNDENIELDIKAMSDSLAEYEENDFYTEWESENPKYINLKGTSAELQGSEAVISNSIITISSPGTYVLSGKLENGQILVETDSKEAVRLILNNAEINCSDNAPIYVKSAGKVILSLAENTNNIITDGSVYIGTVDDEPNAAIYCKDDLTINGSGTLTVNANYNNGISGKDDFKITGGNIIINSVDDGLLGRDLLAIKDGNITINSQGDAMKSTNDSETDRGNIVLENGTFIINSGSDGIQAESSITILGGDYTINSTDDSIHSNKYIDIAGGIFNITSEDDGMHADSKINITDGTINVLKSYEGIESAIINILDGEINILSSDDGINIAVKQDNSSMDGRNRKDTFTSSSDNSLNISGGIIYVSSSGDGLDVNGSVFISGGTVIVDGPISNGNGSLDYDQKFEISGGLLIASGSAGMAQAPSEGSTQNSVFLSFSSLQKAGTSINVTDESGNNIITYAPSKDYQTLLISSPDLKLNSYYALYTGGESTGVKSDGLYTEGLYEGGTKLTDFTVSKSVLSINEKGEEIAGSTFTPGKGGFGGKQGDMRNNENMPEGERPQMPEGEVPQMPNRERPPMSGGENS